MLTAVMQDRKGISALEYGVLAVAVIGAVATAAGLLAGDVKTLFDNVGSAI